MPLGTRRFDLYDFFSVFVPGAIFLIGLFPFFPDNTKVGSLTALLPLLVGGYVVGRGIHSVAAKFDERGGTHRTQFFKQLTADDPPDVSKSAVREFLEECDAVFGEAIYEDKKAKQPPWEREIAEETLYSAVRSYIHLDGRGRSRTFQAIYAFHRTMWIIVLSLGIIYTGYGVARIFGRVEGTVEYASFIRGIGLDPLLIITLSSFGLGVSFATFRRSKRPYRRLFAEYLILDFITIRSTLTEEQGPDGNQSGQGTRPPTGRQGARQDERQPGQSETETE